MSFDSSFLLALLPPLGDQSPKSGHFFGIRQKIRKSGTTYHDTYSQECLRHKGNTMITKKLTVTWTLFVAAAALLSSGCFQAAGPSLGIFSVPIPVSPYLQKNAEDKFYIHERYARVPILGPLQPGGPVKALDPPSDDEVWWALERADSVQGGFPFLHEVQRNNVTIIKEKIADYVDPPRVVPLIGPVQLHHAHYKCTIYFTKREIHGWPIPHTLVDEDSVEVVYIDHNHFHMVGNVDLGKSNTHY